MSESRFAKAIRARQIGASVALKEHKAELEAVRDRGYPDKWGHNQTMMRFWNHVGLIVDRALCVWESETVAVAVAPDDHVRLAKIDLLRDGRSVASFVLRDPDMQSISKKTRVFFNTESGKVLYG